MQTITHDQIQKNAANLVIVDARSAEKFAQGHIPGAINIPQDKVTELAPTLLANKDAQIVTYCSSTACTASTTAAEKLSTLGYKNVAAYLEGKEGWVASGQKLEGESCSAGACSTQKSGTCG